MCLRSRLKLARPYIWRLSILILSDGVIDLRGAAGEGQAVGDACWSVRILDTAEAAAPARRTLARQLLEAEARHLGVSLEVGAPSARRAEGAPALHITAAADQLLEHLAVIEATVPQTKA